MQSGKESSDNSQNTMARLINQTIHEAAIATGDMAVLLFVGVAYKISNATFYKLLENRLVMIILVL